MAVGCCAIVEPRSHAALGFVVQSVRRTIPDWPIIVFHGTGNEEFARDACRDIDQVSYRSLRVHDLSLKDYNLLLTRPHFYDHFEGYEYVLIFQTDSMLFPHSPFRIEDFLGYDYVGAPWRWRPEALGGNGGLSLRRVASLQSALKESPYVPDRFVQEDLHISRLPLVFPDRQIARRFSVESVPYGTPLGAHKPWWYLDPDEYVSLSRFAPIVKTLFDLN